MRPRLALGILELQLEELTESEWDATNLEAVVRKCAADLGIKLAELTQPLRIALTGRTVSMGIFEIMAILGREESLGRISDQTG